MLKDLSSAKNRRRSARFPFKENLNLGINSLENSGRSINLSMHGIFIESKKIFDKDTNLLIRVIDIPSFNFTTTKLISGINKRFPFFELLEQIEIFYPISNQITFSGKVIWSKDIDDKGLMGIEFSDVSNRMLSEYFRLSG